jgi:hypothetical protein
MFSGRNNYWCYFTPDRPPSVYDRRRDDDGRIN